VIIEKERGEKQRCPEFRIKTCKINRIGGSGRHFEKFCNMGYSQRLIFKK